MGPCMNRIAKSVWGLVLLALAMLLASPAHADGTSVLPVSGTATYNQQWNFSLSGPSLSFHGGTLVDKSMFTSCTEGTPCNLSATMQDESSCLIISCGASFEGQSYNDWLNGTLTLVGAVFAPQATGSGPNSFTLTAPAVIYGQLFAVNCPEPTTPSKCDSEPAIFGFNIFGIGTVTASGIANFPGGLDQDAIFNVQYSFSGFAEDAPEPPAWLIYLMGSVFLGWRARKEKGWRRTSVWLADRVRSSS
jgi:hypothetical protein